MQCVCALQDCQQRCAAPHAAAAGSGADDVDARVAAAVADARAAAEAEAEEEMEDLLACLGGCSAQQTVYGWYNVSGFLQRVKDMAMNGNIQAKTESQMAWVAGMHSMSKYRLTASSLVRLLAEAAAVLSWHAGLRVTRALHKALAQHLPSVLSYPVLPLHCCCR